MKYFKFFVADFLVGTHHFTDAEVGIYVRMLCHQWDKEFLPGTDAELKSIFGSGITAKVLDKFPLTDFGRANERLAKERGKAKAKTEKMSKNGSKGANSRWSGDMKQPPPAPGDKKPHAFYIGIHGFDCKPSEWMKEHGQTFIETQLMKHRLGDKAPGVLAKALELLDSDYTSFDFNNDNHLKNCFKVCLTKVLTEKPGAKLSKDGSTTF